MSDAQRLYDVLDRLCFDLIELSGEQPHHRYSPLGSAIHALHELRQYAGERCICVTNYRNPPA